MSAKGSDLPSLWNQAPAVNAEALDLPALAATFEEDFWRALLRPWPAETGARLIRIAITARLASGLYISALRLHDRVPFAHSIRVWVRAAQGEMPLLHFHVPADFPDAEIAAQQMGLQPDGLWIASLREALAALQPEQLDRLIHPIPGAAAGAPGLFAPSLPADGVQYSASFPDLAPAGAAAVETPPEELARWLRGAPRMPDETPPPSETVPLPALPGSVAVPSGSAEAASALAPALEAAAGQILAGQRQANEAAGREVAALEEQLARHWASALLRPPIARTDAGWSESLAQAEAWAAAGCHSDTLDTLPTAPLSALGSSAQPAPDLAASRQVYASLLRARGHREAWSAALASACIALYGTHRPAPDGAACARCGAPLDAESASLAR